jgi:hypothetical protein
MLSGACLVLWLNSAKRSFHPDSARLLDPKPDTWHIGWWDAIWVYERPAKVQRVRKVWTYFAPTSMSDAQAELYRGFRQDGIDPERAAEAAVLLV